MYRFVLRPRWFVGHVTVGLAIALMISLGFWQLRRLEERREYNQKLAERTAASTADVSELAPRAERDVDAVEYRSVRLTGRFDTSDDVLVGYRSLHGVSGHHVVTPLVLADGTAVLVNRGWVPAHFAEDWPVPDAAAPRGTVEVAGYLRASETRGSFGPRDPDSGELRLVSRVDVDRIAQQIDEPVRPFWVQMEAPVPADGIPAPVPLADLGEGNHLSYAFQWFIFASGSGVGWLILLRVSARRRALARDAPSQENEASSPPVQAHGLS